MKCFSLFLGDELGSREILCDKVSAKNNKENIIIIIKVNNKS